MRLRTPKRKAKAKRKPKGAARGGSSRRPYDETLHPRDSSGHFADKPNAGDDAPKKGRRPRASDRPKKVRALKAKGKIVGTKAQRFAEDGKEREIAKGLGMKRLDDNEAVDNIAPRKGGGLDGIELKTLVTQGKRNASIKIHDDAMLRKADFVDGRLQPNTKRQLDAEGIAYEEGTPNTLHIVAYDGRAEYAGGKYKELYSGNDLYYKRGAPKNFSLSQMYRVKDVDELKRLVAMPDDQLPAKARGPRPTARSPEAEKKAAEEAAKKKVRKERYLARLAAGLVGT